MIQTACPNALYLRPQVSLVLFTGGKLVLSGRLTVGELTSFVLVSPALTASAAHTMLARCGRQQPAVADLLCLHEYVIFVATTFGTLSGLYGQFMKAVGASTRVFELMDRVPKIANTGGKVPSESR